MGQTWPLFAYFRSIQTQILEKNSAVIQQDSNLDRKVEDEYADHLPPPRPTHSKYFCTNNKVAYLTTLES